MKCKKILIVTLVIILLTTSMSAVSSARFSILSNDSKDHIEDTGIIEKQKLNFIDSSEDIYIINGDKGIVFLGLIFKRYAPINLPEEFKNEGIKVEFIGEVSIMHILTARGLNSLINLRALPIKILDIREISGEPDLDFGISINDNYDFGDPIPVKATLTNNGDSPIKVVDMDPNANGHFVITDQNGGKLRYIGPEGYLRKPILLDPRESVSITVDIQEVYGYLEDYLDPKDLPSGKYSIQGFYSSGNFIIPPTST